MPVVSFKSRFNVVRISYLCVSFNAYMIVVIKKYEFTESEMPRYRCGFVRCAFHQIAVAAESICMMINYIKIIFVIKCGKMAFGYGHPYGIHNTLSERTGGRFHSRRKSVFRVTRCFAVPLPEIFNIVERKIVAG